MTVTRNRSACASPASRSSARASDPTSGAPRPRDLASALTSPAPPACGTNRSRDQENMTGANRSLYNCFTYLQSTYYLRCFINIMILTMKLFKYLNILYLLQLAVYMTMYNCIIDKRRSRHRVKSQVQAHSIAEIVPSQNLLMVARLMSLGVQKSTLGLYWDCTPFRVDTEDHTFTTES